MSETLAAKLDDAGRADVYFILLAGANVINAGTGAAVALGDAAWTAAAIAASDSGHVTVYTAQTPAGLAAGAYTVQAYARAGATAAITDEAITDSETLVWNGQQETEPPVYEATEAYNTRAQARSTATTLGLTRVTAAADAVLTAALIRAAMQIDARRFQGRKFSLEQERQFPRVRDDVRAGWRDFPPSYPLALSPSYDYGIWDWDATTGEAVVPDQVKLAECLQAEYLLGTPNTQRQQAIADGVASQGVGGQNESYRADARAESLCVEAKQMLAKYQLVSGLML